MKALFAGDIHNHMYIFDDVVRLDKEYNFDKIIFVGDYVDDWNTSNIESIECLRKLIKLKQSNYRKYILLLGNHELSYLGYPCSGHDYTNDTEIKNILTDNIDLFKFYIVIHLGNKDFVCSHAGFVNDYLVNVFQPNNTDWQETLKNLNTDMLNKLNLLTYCSFHRGGKYPFSSFVWTDARELIHNREELLLPNQIVGHSPVKTIKYITSDTNNLYFIDTHSTYRNGEPYGDKSYLIWNTDKFEIVK